MPTELIADIQDVFKKYGKTVALDGLSLQIPADRAIALIGPNGAGKTTFIEILLGLRQPDRGYVQVLGHDVVRNPQAHVDRLGIQLQDSKLFAKATPREYLKFFSQLYSRSLPIGDLARTLGIEASLDIQLGKLSGGQRQRVALGLALINDPDFVILDEPTVGLDPIARREFWDLITHLRKDGRTLLFSTHYMEEAEALADEIIMISHGRLIANGTTRDVIDRARPHGCTNLDEAYRHYAGVAARESRAA
jgi:ABC-2 type transport system ATP-binding protein